MYMADGWIAVLRRSVLEVYTHDGHHYTFWRNLNIPHSVGTASFLQTGPRGSPTHQSPTLKLCITYSRGVFVYEMMCDPAKNVLSLDPIWYYRGTYVDGQSPLLTRGMLGVTGGSVQWLHGSSCNRYFTI